MQRDEASVLDMMRAAKEALSFVAGKDGDEFAQDRMLQRPVERSLEIIGEAAKRVSDEYRNSHPEVPWRSAAGLRDVISHQYDRVAPKRIWATLTETLPELVSVLQPLVKEESGGD